MIAKGGTLRSCNTNSNQMEKQMIIKRVFLVLAAALLLPGLALAGHTAPEAGMVDFDVNLVFTPDSDDKITVSFDCSGVDAPISDSDLLGDGDNTSFDTSSPGINNATCVVTVVGSVNGYSPVFTAGGDSPSSDSTPSLNCTFGEDMANNDVNTCDIAMIADDVTFTVTKVWDVTLVGGDVLNPSYDITLLCDAEITDDGGDRSRSANVCADNEIFGNDPVNPTLWWCVWNEQGTDDETEFEVTVDATGAAPGCWATESIVDSAVATDNDCGSSSSPIDIDLGDSEECTIINTAFFEGIPTLNQYGLAIMALLMLGVGFVGFRRFV